MNSLQPWERGYLAGRRFGDWIKTNSLRFVLILFFLVLALFAHGQLNISGGGTGAVLSGTTAAIGGSQLLIAQCTSGTATVAGAGVTMPAVASPATYPGDGIFWDSQVTSANTVTVKVCSLATLTPTSSVYYVRVLP